MRRGPLPVAVRASAAFALWMLGFVARAEAEECRRPDIIETIPDDDAKGVPLNARPIARYETAAEYLDEDIGFTHVGADTFTIKGSFDPAEGILTIDPPEPLEAGESYQIRWPELRGIATASLGRGRTITFTAGSREDTKAPTFGGVKSVDWDVDRRTDECTDTVEDRLKFDIKLGKASDDGGRDLLTLVVFQTAGPEIGPKDPPLPVRVGKMPDDDEIHFKQAVDLAVGHVCFAAIVRDLTGLASASGSKEVCVDTVAPPFFYGCSVSQRPVHTRAGIMALLFLVVLPLRRRRRR